MKSRDSSKPDNRQSRPRPAAFAMCLAVAGVLSLLQCRATTVRTRADERLWETVADGSAPLSWPWAESADSATLVFSNRIARTVSHARVPRGANELRGICHCPPSRAGDSIFDMTLVQTAGDGVVERETATVAFVSGAGGGPITVRAMLSPERELARLREPRVIAFDPAWIGETGGSCYDIAWPAYRGFAAIVR